MRFGIPLLGNQVAPRSTGADTLLLVTVRRHQVRQDARLQLVQRDLAELSRVLSEHRIDVIVCGAISPNERDFLTARGIRVIDNVLASPAEVIAALQAGQLQSGLGFATPQRQRGRRSRGGKRPPQPENQSLEIDCLACRERPCERNQPCPVIASLGEGENTHADRTLEAVHDIAAESERTLCRLSELIYFCIEMDFHRLGVAYCTDLEEPAEILTRVLRRCFTVFPICCRIQGRSEEGGREHLLPDSVGRCNPSLQAAILNHLGTELNILVGLCMGADCVFERASNALVTTLFVKDKSLANNPIGAVYSDYYIKEALTAAVTSRERTL